MKTQTLSIKLNNATTFPVHGPFAVHRQLNSLKRWQVTHRPTCYSTLSNRGTDTRKHALDFAKWLRAMPINWDQDDATVLQRDFTSLGIRIINVIEEIENPANTETSNDNSC